MFNRVVLTLSTLIFMTGAYTLYVRLVVPHIEPDTPTLQQDELPSRVSDTSDEMPITDNPVARQLARQIFGPDAWQTEAEMIMRFSGEHLSIFFYAQDYEEDASGELVLKPLTILIRDDPTENIAAETSTPETTDHSKDPHPGPSITTLVSPRARIQFDELDLTQLRAGKPHSGVLEGAVIIEHRKNSENTETPLHIETSNLHFSNIPHPDASDNIPRLTTDDAVRFTDGTNDGQGVGLDIELVPETSENTSKTIEVSGIRALTIRKHVELSLTAERENTSLLPSPRNSEHNVSETPSAIPVTIQCAGPFQFDFRTDTALFRDSVQVRALTPSGTSDKLDCEQLEIVFDRSESHDNLTPSTTSFRKILAIGNPLILHSEDNQLHLLARRLHHDPVTKVLKLKNQQGVVKIVHEQAAIEAPEIVLKQNEQGEWTHLDALGPGSFQGRTPEPEQQILKSRWTNQLGIRRTQKRAVLRWYGNALLEDNQQGTLRGDRIALWLNLIEHSEPSDSSLLQTSAQDVPSGRWMPSEIEAAGKVSLHTPQLTGTYQKLNLQLIDRKPSQETVARTKTTRNLPPPTPSLSPQNPVTVHAVQLTASLLRDGEETSIEQLNASGNVRIEQPDNTSSTGSLKLRGDDLTLTENANTFTLSGTPASVITQEFDLQGPQITLNRFDNHLQVTGNGKLDLPVNKDLEGQLLPKTQNLQIEWSRRFFFDGKNAHFKGDIHAQLESTELLCGYMKVTFQKSIDFSGNLSRSEQDNQIYKILCHSGQSDPDSPVELYKRVFQQGRLSDYQHAKSRQLDLNVQTGDLRANGPGLFVSIRPSSLSDDLFSENTTQPSSSLRRSSRKHKLTRNTQRDLQARATGPVSSVTANKGLLSEKTAARLKHLEIIYQGTMTSNLRKRIAIFRDRVEVLHSPVDQIEEPVDRFHLRDDGLWLRCEQLNLSQIRHTTATASRNNPLQRIESVEMTALKNVEAEIQKNGFHIATADRISYSEAKDQLILEGQQSHPARISRQTKRGASPSRFSGGKITYYPGTQHLKIDDTEILHFQP